MNSIFRIQTVSVKSNSFLYQILVSLKEFTGHPLAINTSLNVNNELIVCTASDAIRCLFGIDVLILGDSIVRKKSSGRIEVPTSPPELVLGVPEAISDFIYTLT